MGIFDFLKNKKRAAIDVKNENMAFEDIENWSEKKKDIFSKEEVEILEDIGKKLDGFCVSINEKLGVLEEIDIESKKEHGRAKIFVRQGLDGYVNSVRVLIKDINALEKDNLEKFALDIGEKFTRFEKTSAIFYDRANYLIGDEMAAVRNGIRRFYNELIGLFEGNKSLIENSRKLERINLILKEVEGVNNNFVGTGKDIESNEKEIEKIKDEISKLDGKIKKIKNSSEYISNLKTGEKIKSLGAELNVEIGKLKNLIDFKKLTNIIHSNQRELEIVKNYKDHFAFEFSRDKGKKILDLLENSRMKNPDILAQIDLIKKRSVELNKRREEVGLDNTIIKSKEIKENEQESENLELENVKNKRRLDEFELKLKGLKNEVIRLVKDFGVVVV